MMRLSLSLNKLKLKNLYCEKDVEDECQCSNAFFSVLSRSRLFSRTSLVSVIYMHFSYLQIKSDLPFFLLRWDFKKASKTYHTRVLYKGTQLKRVIKKKLKKEIT